MRHTFGLGTPFLQVFSVTLAAITLPFCITVESAAVFAFQISLVDSKSRCLRRIHISVCLESECLSTGRRLSCQLIWQRTATLTYTLRYNVRCVPNVCFVLICVETESVIVAYNPFERASSKCLAKNPSLWYHSGTRSLCRTCQTESWQSGARSRKKTSPRITVRRARSGALSSCLPSVT